MRVVVRYTDWHMPSLIAAPVLLLLVLSGIWFYYHGQAATQSVVSREPAAVVPVNPEPQIEEAGEVFDEPQLEPGDAEAMSEAEVSTLPDAEVIVPEPPAEAAPTLEAISSAEETTVQESAAAELDTAPETTTGAAATTTGWQHPGTITR